MMNFYRKNDGLYFEGPVSVEEIEAIEHPLLTTFLHQSPGLQCLSAEIPG